MVASHRVISHAEGWSWSRMEKHTWEDLPSPALEETHIRVT